jgi:hypothetical protein
LGFLPGGAGRGAIGWGAFTLAMSAPSSRTCLHCRAAFVPCPTHRTTQHYCAKPECRKASKAAAQARWRQQPHNRAYFRGPEHVERVRRWRARHPGYWRKKPPPPALALQDFACPQSSPAELFTTAPAGGPRPAESPRGDALQDLADLQVPLLAGVVSLLLGDALQGRFAELTRQLVDRGKRVLAAER